MQSLTVVAEPIAPARGCDCSICPLFMENPDAAEPVCSGSNSDCSYCGCARAAAAGASGCSQCSVRCGSRTDIADWMTDIGGTITFDDLDLGGLELPGLPSFIPQVETKEIAELDAGLHWPAYAVGLRRVISDKTMEVLPGYQDCTARDALGLASDQAAVLVGYGKDPLVEAFWTNRATLIEALAAQQWDLVLAPNFSAYGNFPRAEQLINYRRNLLIAQEMLEAGVPAVPNIYSFRLEDLRRYEAWFDRHDPPAVACNLQTQRIDRVFYELLLPGLTYLARVMGPQTRFIATGSSRPKRITELLDLFGDRLTLVSQNAIQYARHGAVMTAEGRQDVHAHIGDAFRANVRFYADQLTSHGVDQ